MSEDVPLEEFTEKSDDGGNPRESVFGEIPSDWSASDLDDPELFSVTSSGLEPFEDEKIYVPTGEVERGEIIGDDGTVSYDDRPSRANLAVRVGDVLFAKMKDSIKVVRATQDLSEDYIFSTGFVRVTTTDSVNSDFLKQILLSNRFNQSKDSLAIGSTQPAINLSDLSALIVPVPPIDEQRKIASVLYTVDQAIQKTEELIDQAERVKRGLTQSLLNNGINDESQVKTDSRFGKLPESWELHPLKEVGKIAGRTAPEKDESDCWGGNIPWATPSEITSLEGPTISDTEEHLTEIALEKVSSNLLPPGSVLLTTRATIGECAVNTVEMTTNQGFKNLIPGDRIDTWYAYYRFEYEGDYLASLSKGSTFPEVGKDTVENFVIPIPPLEEQKEIGERLKSVDDMILSYKSNKKQLQHLKQGLMQDLLSGEVRTQDKDIELVDKVLQHG